MSATPTAISVVVLARNEAHNIEQCLQSLRWASEVLVVDDGSSDDTARLAQAAGARVVQHRFESFAKQRNWAIQHGGLRYDWSLHLDADERATPEFARELASRLDVAGDDLAALRICRKTMFLDKWLRRSDGFPVWIMRVVKRGRAQFVDSGHGEVPVPPVDGKVESIREAIMHYPFSKGLDDWFDRHNRYSTREAQRELHSAPAIRVRELLAWDAATRRRALRDFSRRMPCRAVTRFMYQYIWRRGFLDGRAGLTYCTLMAIYESMIVAKTREMSHRSRERIAFDGRPTDGQGK